MGKVTLYKLLSETPLRHGADGINRAANALWAGRFLPSSVLLFLSLNIKRILYYGYQLFVALCVLWVSPWCGGGGGVQKHNSDIRSAAFYRDPNLTLAGLSSKGWGSHYNFLACDAQQPIRFQSLFLRLCGSDFGSCSKKSRQRSAQDSSAGRSTSTRSPHRRDHHGSWVLGRTQGFHRE